MNLIELVTALPNWQWKKHSQEEIILTGEQLVEMSDFVWRVGNVAVVGFTYISYTSPPWLWFVLAEKVGIADLVDFRRLTRQIPKGTLTAVAADFPMGFKFAKLYGFEETGEKVEYSERAFKIMRKV
jgi:hypothetical protein